MLTCSEEVEFMGAGYGERMKVSVQEVEMAISGMRGDKIERNWC